MTNTTSTPSKHRPTAADIEDFIIDRVVSYTNVSAAEVDSNSAFTSLGLGSKDVLLLIGDLEQWLDCELAPTLAWEYPTIGEMAGHLAELASGSRE